MKQILKQFGKSKKKEHSPSLTIADDLGPSTSIPRIAGPMSSVPATAVTAGIEGTRAGVAVSVSLISIVLA
jgi:hypothetical protein